MTTTPETALMVLGLGVVVSMAVVLCEAPLTTFARRRWPRANLHLEGGALLLGAVLVFDAVALVLLVGSSILPR